MAVVFTKGWYDSSDGAGGDPTTAAQLVTAVLSERGSSARICNAVFVDSTIPTAGRTAIYNQVTSFSGGSDPGAAYQYRIESGDPGNELLAYADACYSEGV